MRSKLKIYFLMISIQIITIQRGTNTANFLVVSIDFKETPSFFVRIFWRAAGRLNKKADKQFGFILREIVKKKGYFTVRLTISECENFDPFFFIEF